MKELVCTISHEPTVGASFCVNGDIFPLKYVKTRFDQLTKVTAGLFLETFLSEDGISNVDIIKNIYESNIEDPIDLCIVAFFTGQVLVKFNESVGKKLILSVILSRKTRPSEAVESFVESLVEVIKTNKKLQMFNLETCKTIGIFLTLGAIDHVMDNVDKYLSIKE